MTKFKKVCRGIFGLLLCLTMLGGCSSTPSQDKQNNKVNEVKAAFSTAVEKFLAATHEHSVETVEVSDASMWNTDTQMIWGSKLQFTKREFEANYEVRKNAEGKATDDKLSQMIEKRTGRYPNGTANIYYYTPGDGWHYTDFSGMKSKRTLTLGFEALGSRYSYLMPEAIADDITLTTENNKKVFNFTVKSGYQTLVPADMWTSKDSNVENVEFKGKLAFDEKGDKTTLSLDLKYKDKATNHTLNYTLISNCDNEPHDLPFPSDLSTYKAM